MSSYSLPALPAAPTPARPRVLTIGTALAAAAAVMVFAGLLGVYLSVRSNEISQVTQATKEATCLGFLEGHPDLGPRVGAGEGDGSGCIAAMQARSVLEGPCNPETGRPDPDPERDPQYNLFDSQVPTCEVLRFVNNPEISGSGWLPAGTTIPLTPGSMGMFTLVMSLGTVVWAVWAARNRAKGQTYAALAITILLGLAYANQIVSLYPQMGLVLNETKQAVLIYAITGAHLLMAGVALVYISLMALRTLAGQFTGRDSEALSAAAMFWFVTVGVYAVIWFTILVSK